MNNAMSVNNNKLSKILNNFTDKISTLNGNNEKNYESSKNLINTLYNMDREYKKKLKEKMPNYDKTLPKTTFTEKKEYKEKSEAEIEKIAEDNLQEEYYNKYKKLNENLNLKQHSLNNKLVNEEEDLKNSIAKANNQYVESGNKIDSKTVNQGLKNSSIYELTKQNNFDMWKSMLNDIQSEFDIYQKNIELQISQLGMEKRDALLQSDLSYALDKENEINKLYKEQAKAIEEINSYNKKITQEAIKYNEQRLETISDMEDKWWKDKLDELDYQSSNGYEGSNYLEMENRYNLARDFYKSINLKDAKELIENNKNSLKQTLGIKNYSRLVEEINGK